ncbi:unnamed protein product [Rotaria sordida]|uniref:Uncharacterized protein n=1 Tax=Rotaria sordida TaxID=392033 RepID=A0A818P9S4_9BILA|nr:unnamed protein product [Rotaria sordida]CAF0839306.1 unnamed protein product [Rotaria sordida]CAF3619135.1 unnamed protein product [Rotaria sordida]CAF3651003.1 unnamed protein product [Rotaria sordida]
MKYLIYSYDELILMNKNVKTIKHIYLCRNNLSFNGENLSGNYLNESVLTETIFLSTTYYYLNLANYYITLIRLENIENFFPLNILKNNLNEFYSLTILDLNNV